MSRQRSLPCAMLLTLTRSSSWSVPGERIRDRARSVPVLPGLGSGLRAGLGARVRVRVGVRVRVRVRLRARARVRARVRRVAACEENARLTLTLALGGPAA